MDGVVDTYQRKGDVQTMKNMKKKILGVGLLAILVIALTALYFVFREKPVEGSKSITIEVINSAKESKLYELHTDAEFLKQAMEETAGLTFSGTEGAYGLMIEAVNGETAIYAENGAYWSFYVNGGYCNYGIAEQPVEDGDAFQIVYTK